MRIRNTLMLMTPGPFDGFGGLFRALLKEDLFSLAYGTMAA